MQFPNGYEEVYTRDESRLIVYVDYSSDCQYQISDSKSSYNVKFVEYDGTHLVFVDECNVTHLIDPTNPITRDKISIFNTSLGEEVDWYRIYNVPFDTSFFKVGNVYQMRKEGGGRYYPVMLIGMNLEQLHFIHVAHPENIKDPGINHEYITADRYKHMKKDYWFKELFTKAEIIDSVAKPYPLIAVRKYIKEKINNLPSSDSIDNSAVKEVLLEINGLIVSEMNSAYGTTFDEEGDS